MSNFRVYFDESGNSGSNLLDKNQPIYTLVSHNFENKEIASLLEKLKLVSKATELHFKALKRRPRTQQAIIDLLNHPLIDEGRIFHYHAVKDFMIIIQIVDWLIEPVIYRLGIDMYQYGRNLSTANMIYILSVTVWDVKLFNSIKDSFMRFFKEKSAEAEGAFYESVSVLMNDNIEKGRRDLNKILNWIFASRDILSDILPHVVKYSFDPTLSCFAVHCDYWGKQTNSNFDVIFDDSKQIMYWRELIEFLTKSLPKQEVGFGSRTMNYPLLIDEISLVDSKSREGIQLADILASSITYATRMDYLNVDDEFAEEIWKTNLFTKVTGSAMKPELKITPEDLNMEEGRGTNMLDFIAENAHKNGGFPSPNFDTK